MKAMAAMKATKAMKAKPGALTTTGDNSSVAKSMKLKPKDAAKALPMKAMAAMSAKKATKGMKAKKRNTGVVDSMTTPPWPIPWTEGICWVDRYNGPGNMRIASALEVMKAMFEGHSVQ